MKPQSQNTGRRDRRSTRKVRLAVTLAITLGSHLGQADEEGSSSYDESILLSPSKAVLLAERKGRVTIYDGLEHRVVDRALDTQFARIENMMFVRTRESLPDGSWEIDDDCE